MCGIAGGAFSVGSNGTDIVAAMLRLIAHRGPDGEGVWSDAGAGIALGQRRLAIIDLSDAGRQPMASSSGRFVAVYNGEIYNYLKLKEDLERYRGHKIAWRGHSDTEVLLAGFDEWGIEETLRRANGMFALAVWDTSNRCLYLARDRMGEKPLYFGWVDRCFAFASELKSFTCRPGWDPRVNESQVAGFLYTGYIRGAESAIQGIYRLPPGAILKLDNIDLTRPLNRHELEVRYAYFWSLEQAALDGIRHPFEGDFGTAANALESLLLEAVASRMISDVPLGAFLSGGIDSSLIVALMQRHSTRPVRTYSIGFAEQGFDEAPYGREVSKHLGTDHTELYVAAADALSVIPELPEIYDEPFADQSAIPTLLVSRLARQDVTVALSGDGGDELFAGYARYDSILPIWRVLHGLSPKGRRIAAAFTRAAAQLSRPLDHFTESNRAFRLGRLADRIQSRDLDSLRLSFIAGAGSRALLHRGFREACAARIPIGIREPLKQLLFGDQADYLPDNILVKLDRASMAVSLETRAPFLDHRLVEFSWRLPRKFLHAPSQGKLILKHVLYRSVPRRLLDRPKQGFAPPIGAWLRGPLKDWANELLAESSLRDLPMIDPAFVRSLWRDHLDSRMDASYALWNVLMLAAWRCRMSAAC